MNRHFEGEHDEFDEETLIHLHYHLFNYEADAKEYSNYSSLV